MFCASVWGETLKVGVSKDTASFNDFSIGKLECAFKLAGYELELIELPIERNYQSIQNGAVDVDPMRVRAAIESASNVVYIPTPMLTIEKWIYYRIDGNAVSPTNMKEHLLIPIIGVHCYDKFKQQGFPMLDAVVALDSAFKMLNAGRGDYVLWTQDGKAIVESLNIAHAIGQVQLGEGEPLYTVLHEKHRDKIPALDAAYKRVFTLGDCPLGESVMVH